MSRVFIDALALTVGPAGAGRRTLAPGAEAALARLIDAGHEVVLLGGGFGDLARDFRQTLARVPALPGGVRGAWLLTGDPDRCGSHQGGFRMVLVGPGPGQRTLPTRHCDAEVRDLTQAVLSVLLEDVMPARV